MLFVSHATADNDRVDQLANRLRSKGIDALWIDHNFGAEQGISIGDEWQRAIQQAVNDSEACIFIMTPASVASRWCQAEWTHFLTQKKPVYPVMLESVPQDEVPLRLGLIHYADFIKDYDQGLETLARALKHEVKPALPEHGTKETKRITGEIDSRLRVSMYGRDNYLLEALEGIQEAPLFITGIGGLGKSRLAYALVKHVKWSSAVWHNCTDITTAEQLYETLRNHYNPKISTVSYDLLEQIRDDGNLLVVIDNGESITDNDRRRNYVQLIETLFDAKAAICITSRVEWREITVKRRLELKQLDSAAAIKMVLDRTRPFNIKQSINNFAYELTEAARRHPRLIELATNKLEYMPPLAVIKQLHKLEVSDTQDILEEIVGSTIEQMTRQHGDMPRIMLCRLAVCRGGFAAEEGQTILRAEEDEFFGFMRILTNFGLIHFDGERYMIDELVIEAVDIDELSQKVHFKTYLEFAQKYDKSSDSSKFLKMDEEWGNFQAAFEWGLANNSSETLSLATACGYYLANRGKSVERLEWFSALVQVIDKLDKDKWASLYNSLGIAYQDYPVGHRQENLKQAITAHNSALNRLTGENNPLEFAATQNNLGNAFANLADYEDHEGNLQRAIASYELALIYRKPENDPLNYSATQNNLGNTYQLLAKIQNRFDNISRALNHYEAALVYWTADSAPLNYATVQNNIGNTYIILSESEYQLDNLRLAIAAYETALIYRTADTAPLDYATTQYNLGTTYLRLAKLEDRSNNLKRAQGAYKAALFYGMSEVAPLQYAKLQGNLGVVLNNLGDLAGAIFHWYESERQLVKIGNEDDANKLRIWIKQGEHILGQLPVL